MMIFTNQTIQRKKKEKINRWILIDAQNVTLGKLATLTSMILRDKFNKDFSPSIDMGNYVIIINAAFIKISGNKLKQKFYYKHSGRPGGLKKKSMNQIFQENPEYLVEKAIKGMLPKNRLGREYFRRLKVFKDSSHSFENKNIEIHNLYD